ncbi:MAG: amidohydrolase family protein [Nitrospinota bacterium]
MPDRFDVLLKGATIYDGTGGPPFSGDVAVRNDEIAALRRDPPSGSAIRMEARRTLSLNGKALGPGFIDIHSHSDYSLLVNPLAESKIRQGVTTEVGGNCGYSAAPIFGEARDERRKTYQQRFGLDPDFSEVKEYLDRLDGLGLSVNYVHQVGHNTLRQSVMGGASRPPTDGELGTMVEGVARGMSQGAFGLSTGLVYAPACFAPLKETTALAAASAKCGGLFSVHLRSEGAGLLEAIEEVIRVARQSGARLQISHLKTAGRENWSKIDRALDLIEDAAGAGIDVACDRYPYTASNTHLSALLPDWVHNGGKRETVAKLQNPSDRSRIRQAWRQKGPGYWDNVVISLVGRTDNKPFEGLSVSASSSRTGQDPADFAMDLLVAEDLWVEIVLLNLMDESNLRKILKRPYVFVASDAEARAHYGPLGWGAPHPRAFGTFPRVLGDLVRGEGLMPLSEAVARMTLLPAGRVGLLDRGRISPGMKADLVVFDPDRIRDASSFGASIRYPQGIDLVMVNGEVTVEKGVHLGTRAGRALRWNERRPPHGGERAC